MAWAPLLHFVSLFEHGLAYGRQHSKDGEDSVIKGETLLAQAVVRPSSHTGIMPCIHTMCRSGSNQDTIVANMSKAQKTSESMQQCL